MEVTLVSGDTSPREDIYKRQRVTLKCITVTLRLRNGVLRENEKLSLRDFGRVTSASLSIRTTRASTRLPPSIQIAATGYPVDVGDSDYLS